MLYLITSVDDVNWQALTVTHTFTFCEMHIAKLLFCGNKRVQKPLTVFSSITYLLHFTTLKHLGLHHSACKTQ